MDIGDIFKWLAESAAAAFTLWVCGVIAVSLLAALFPLTRSWLGQLIDWKWDPQRLRDHQQQVREHNAKPENRDRQRPMLKKVLWRRARTQQYVAKGVGIPMGLGLIAIMVFQLKYGITPEIYAWGVIVWFFTAPVRYWLTMRVSVKLNRQRYQDFLKHPEEFGPAEPMELTAWQLTLKHYRWAMRTPASEKNQKVVAYSNTRFARFLNAAASWIVNFGKLGWLWHIWTAIVILFTAAKALVWPLAYVLSMINSIIVAGEPRPTRYASDRYKVQPGWVSDKVSEPEVEPKPKHRVARPVTDNSVADTTTAP